jgi:hypothetical protein
MTNRMDKDMQKLAQLAKGCEIEFIKLLSEIMKSIKYKMNMSIPRKVPIELRETVLGSIGLSLFITIFSHAENIEDLENVTDTLRQAIDFHFHERKNEILEVN